MGGAGFVGSNLSIYLKNKGYEVTVADNLVRRGSEVNLVEIKENSIKFVHADIRNKEDFKKLNDDYCCVLLCAAQPSAINYSNPEFDITNNTMGVLNTLEFCRRDLTPLIFWSTNKCYSGKVCNQLGEFREFRELNTRYATDHCVFDEHTSLAGNDRSIYGVSKVMADLMIQEWADAYGLPSIINRFSCLAGIRQWGLAEQGWVTWFAIANELELDIEIFGFKGKQVRDCLFVEDLCRLIEKQIGRIDGYLGEVFNVGGGVDNTLSLLEAIQILEQNKRFKSIKFHPQERRADQMVYISDITKAKEHFNWSPQINIQEGYAQILDWVKRNKYKLESMYK